MKTHYTFSQQFRNDISTMMYSSRINRLIKDSTYVIDKYYYSSKAYIDIYKLERDLELIGEQFFTVIKLKPYRYFDRAIDAALNAEYLKPMWDVGAL